MKPRVVLVVVLVLWTLIMVPLPVDAVTTGAATGTTSNSTTLHGSACAGTECWFEYGPVSGSQYMWRSDNVTPSGGNFQIQIQGLPLLSATTYYYRAVDANGDRGSQQSFATLAHSTWTPEPTFGTHTANITRYRWTIPVLAVEIPGPYTDVTPQTMFWAVMMFMLYAGIWISSKNTVMPTFIGLSTSGMLFYASATSLGMSAEFTHVAEGMLIASLASIIFVLIKR